MLHAMLEPRAGGLTREQMRQLPSLVAALEDRVKQLEAQLAEKAGPHPHTSSAPHYGKTH